jgi:hypothetical protein
VAESVDEDYSLTDKIDEEQKDCVCFEVGKGCDTSDYVVYQ